MVGWEHKSLPVSGSRPQASLKAGSQPIEIVTVGIAAGNSEEARLQHILHGVRDVRQIARIGDQGSQGLYDTTAPFGQGKQHDAAVGREPAAVECGCDFLACNGWIGNAEWAIIKHGGCGSGGWCATDGFDTHFLRCFNALRYTRQPNPHGG
jgi:hypothetical protein